MKDGGPISSATMNDPPGEMGSAALPLSTMPGGRPSDPGNGHIDQPAPAEHAALQSRIAELELRLRERVEENIVLDHEVRCLQKERLVTHEYLASLQQDADGSRGRTGPVGDQAPARRCPVRTRGRAVRARCVPQSPVSRPGRPDRRLSSTVSRDVSGRALPRPQDGQPVPELVRGQIPSPVARRPGLRSEAGCAA